MQTYNLIAKVILQSNIKSYQIKAFHYSYSNVSFPNVMKGN